MWHANWQGWLYVAFVVDVYARCTVDALPHHSDQGLQYLSIRYTERLAEASPRPVFKYSSLKGFWRSEEFEVWLLASNISRNPFSKPLKLAAVHTAWRYAEQLPHSQAAACIEIFYKQKRHREGWRS